ncbi:MAG: hypothetical protein JJU21_18220 [Salinarimonas sp.]|nr:hypothetical protein [Salinarimonas sp.]
MARDSALQKQPHPAFGQYRSSTQQRRIGVDALVLILIVLVCVTCIAAFVMSRHLVMPAREEAQEPVIHDLRFGGQSLRVAEHWLAVRDGIPGRLSLRIPLSDIVGEAASPDAQLIVALAAPDRAVAPADRPRLIYARFLSSDASTFGGNLVRRSFRTDTPYEGEVLLLAPPEGRSFAARCGKRNDGPVAPSCSAELRRNGLDIQLQMAKTDVRHWERIVMWLTTDLLAPRD